MNQKALFLDRDGVVNVDKGYICKIKDVEFIEGIFALIKKAKDKDYFSNNYKSVRRRKRVF